MCAGSGQFGQRTAAAVSQVVSQVQPFRVRLVLRNTIPASLDAFVERECGSSSTTCSLSGGATVEVPNGAHKPRGIHAAAFCRGCRPLPKLAAACAHASRMRSCTNIQLTKLSGPHIGRQGPLCATVTCEDLDAHLSSEYDGFEANSLCAQQTSISDQPMPA
jgi:hypothetical protein